MTETRIMELCAEVSTANLYQNSLALSTIGAKPNEPLRGNRYCGKGNQVSPLDVGEMVKQMFMDAGLREDEISMEPTEVWALYPPWGHVPEHGKKIIMNVIGKIEGLEPDKYIIIGGHNDSVNYHDPQCYSDYGGDNEANPPDMLDWFEAPGANDNATSAAIMSEIIRIFRVNSLVPRYTILFGSWGFEEGGLDRGGSHIYAHELAANNADVLLYINLDLNSFLHPNDSIDRVKIAMWTFTTDIDLGDLGQYPNVYGIDPREIAPESYTARMWDIIEKYTDATPQMWPWQNEAQSDSYNFFEAGYPVVFIVDDTKEYGYAQEVAHSPDDIITGCNFEVCKRHTQAALAALIKFAEAEAMGEADWHLLRDEGALLVGALDLPGDVDKVFIEAKYKNGVSITHDVGDPWVGLRQISVPVVYSNQVLELEAKYVKGWDVFTPASVFVDVGNIGTTIIEGSGRYPIPFNTQLRWVDEQGRLTLVCYDALAGMRTYKIESGVCYECDEPGCFIEFKKIMALPAPTGECRICFKDK